MKIFGKVRHRPSASWRQATDRAFTLIGDGRYEDAGALLTRAADMEPWLSESWFNLALLHKFRHDWEQARAAGLRAVALLDKESGAPDWWNVGIAATALQDWPLARRAWQAYGLKVPGAASGTGEPAGMELGSAAVRLSPEGEAEVVWGRLLTRPGSRSSPSRCRPPGAAGVRSSSTTACRTASGPPPPDPPTRSSTRSSCGRPHPSPPGWSSSKRPPRPTGTHWNSWPPRRDSPPRTGRPPCGCSAVPAPSRRCRAPRARASTPTPTTTANRDTPGRSATARPASCGCRSGSAASRPPGLVRGLLDGWVADSPDSREWRDLEEVC